MITATLNPSGTSMSLFDVDEYVGLVIKLDTKRYFALQGGPRAKNGPIMETPAEALKWFISTSGREGKPVNVDFTLLEANVVTHGTLPKSSRPPVKKRQYDWDDDISPPTKPRKQRPSLPPPPRRAPVQTSPPRREETLEEALTESTRLAKEAFNA